MGKEKLWVILSTQGYTGSISTVGRILADLRIRGQIPIRTPLSFYAKSGRHREKTAPWRKKLRRPQHVRVLELDTIVRYLDGQKRYLLTAIDTETRTAFVGAYTNHGSKSAADFLKRCIGVIPDCSPYRPTMALSLPDTFMRLEHASVSLTTTPIRGVRR